MRVHIEFEMGMFTCAVRRGVFCRWLRLSNLGQTGCCLLFGDELFDKGGWLQRSPRCLKEFPPQPEDVRTRPDPECGIT